MNLTQKNLKTLIVAGFTVATTLGSYGIWIFNYHATLATKEEMNNRFLLAKEETDRKFLEASEHSNRLYINLRISDVQDSLRYFKDKDVSEMTEHERLDYEDLRITLQRLKDRRDSIFKFESGE